MKKILPLFLLATALVACGSDDETPAPVPGDQTAEWSFRGDVAVTPLEGSRFNAFDDPDIVFDLVPAIDGSYTLTMNKIKFVEQMPKRIVFDVKGLQLVQQQDGTSLFSAAETLPYWNGEPYDPAGDGTYTIHSLEGMVSFAHDGTPLTLEVGFDCYSMHVAYTGNYTGSKH